MTTIGEALSKLPKSAFPLIPYSEFTEKLIHEHAEEIRNRERKEQAWYVLRDWIDRRTFERLWID